MALPDPGFSTPRVLGVDDFAIRRSQTYSTVLTSVEDHRVVDVLPTREAGPLIAWLVRHSGVEIICRDRASAYAEGARHGAPNALQVADRFHLWQGLGRAVETCVAAHRDCLRSPSPNGMLPEGTKLASGRREGDSVPVGRRAERKKAAHTLVHELLIWAAGSFGEALKSKPSKVACCSNFALRRRRSRATDSRVHDDQDRGDAEEDVR